MTMKVKATSDIEVKLTGGLFMAPAGAEFDVSDEVAGELLALDPQPIELVGQEGEHTSPAPEPES